jgi:hypothetical protein
MEKLMCLDDAHEIRPPKSRSYDAWHKAQLTQLADALSRTFPIPMVWKTEAEIEALYAADQVEPEEAELVKEYKDRRGT